MIVEFEVTAPQAKALFWLLKEHQRETDRGPAARALESLTEALEGQISVDEDVGD